MKLYHVTDRENFKKIFNTGMRPYSYWSNEDLVDYYSEDLDDPVVLFIDIERLDEQYIEPDYPSVEEPITSSIGKSEEQVWEEWEASNGTWKDSLNIVGSIRYTKPIKPNLINIDE